MKKSITQNQYDALQNLAAEATSIIARMNNMDKHACKLLGISSKNIHKDEGNWLIEWLWNNENFTLDLFLEKFGVKVKKK